MYLLLIKQSRNRDTPRTSEPERARMLSTQSLNETTARVCTRDSEFPEHLMTKSNERMWYSRAAS